MNKKTLNRMLELANIKPITENKVELSSLELVKKAANNKVYAIIRENSKYFIKITDKKESLTESDFDYIGGLGNKSKHSYNSFEDATFHLNLMFNELNRINEGSYVNILESDIHLLDEKKYVLKLNKPKAKTQPADDTFDFGGSDEKSTEDTFDFGGEDEDSSDEFDFGGSDEKTDEKTDKDEDSSDEFDFGDESTSDEETEDELDTEDDFSDDEDFDEEDSIKSIQKMTGKLGQKLRDTEDITSDMQKWVAKSVLSALDLGTMDTDDKKDIIRTIKKKSKEEEEPEEEITSSEEEFDFGGEDEKMEESYMSYMDDETCTHCGGTGIDEFTDEECEWCGGENKDHNLMTQKDIDDAMGYISYMKDDKASEKEMDNWIRDMEDEGFYGRPTTKYESYMDDVRVYEDEEEVERGGERELDKGEKILLDYSDIEDEALYGMNPNKYGRSGLDRARREADIDITKHYNKNASPYYDLGPSEDWRKHKLPYDMDINPIDPYENYMSDITDEFETYEQELAYEDLVQLSSEYGYTVSLCHADKTNDPEESTIYFDIKDGSKKIMKARVNSVGDIELGSMKGKHFIGQPVDSLSDYDETFQENGIDMGPQREKSPEKPGRETETKPGREKKRDTDRPSRRPFNPPPHITPGEEPGPKAGQRRQGSNYDPTMAPAPAKEPSEKPSEPTTKPGREKRPDTDRPSRRPFNPPPHITPGEEPGPKAEDDVEFS